jgi:hypothetical protein
MPTYHRMAITLTDKEVAKLGLLHARKKIEHEQLTRERTESVSAFNAQLKTLAAEISKLAHEVDEHVRYEDVEVTLVPDDKRFMMEVLRASNNDRIEVRAMTSDEKEAAIKRNKNPELPFDAGKDGKAAKKQTTIFDAGVKVGPRDATPAPDRIEHKGQSLKKIDRSKKPAAKKAGKAKRGEALP